ncbi:MAG: hypothetical protein V2I67_20110 [Thermoanaerobaculales bacterium]|jgi:hypothetical protein|nr:hypothetical protein [Thermoanaerobaculales bacterium]
MESNKLRFAMLLIVITAGALGMRHYFSPEQVVRRQLHEAIGSFENEKILGVLAKVSRSYSDRWGGTYERLGGYLQPMMDAYDALMVDLDIQSVEMDGDEARIGITFVVSGRTDVGRGDILGGESGPCRATIRWVREEAGWRLSETEELDIPELREELKHRRQR